MLKRSRNCGRYTRLFVSGPLIVLVSLLSTPPCLAWGVTAHRYVNSLAVNCLPPQLKPLYDANIAWISRHAIDPDEWRRDNFAAESPRHFIDLDSDGAEGARDYPDDYWIAVGLLGKSRVDKRGTVPWRIGEYYGKLVRAFRQQDARSIIEISTWLGHYASDAHVPFHATVNYDGQATGQKGIHARFETALVDQMIKPTDLKARASTLIENPVSSAFRWARTSLALCPAILAADKRGLLKDADYGFNYFTEFGSTARPIAIQQLERSAHDTASLWYSAWAQAGKPAVPMATDVHAGVPLDRRTADPDSPAAAPGAGQGAR